MTEDELAQELDRIMIENKTLSEKLITIESEKVEAVKKVAEFGKHPAFTMKAEEIEALKIKASKADELEKSLSQIKIEKSYSDLKLKYPNISDWSAIPEGKIEDMDIQASKISAMIAKNAPKNPGDAFKNVPPANQPSIELADAAKIADTKKALNDAVKSGDSNSVFDGCLKAQPKAAERLFATLGK